MQNYLCWHSMCFSELDKSIIKNNFDVEFHYELICNSILHRFATFRHHNSVRNSEHNLANNLVVTILPTLIRSMT